MIMIWLARPRVRPIRADTGDSGVGFEYVFRVLVFTIVLEGYGKD